MTKFSKLRVQILVFLRPFMDPGGSVNVKKSMSFKMTFAVVLSGLLLAACSSSGHDTSGSSSSDGSHPSSEASQSAGGAPPSGTVTASEVRFAAKYIGGKAGAADPSLSPVVFGFVNQQGGTLSFPDATEGMNATVKFINERLGGIDGHPLVVHTCFAADPSDMQKCATQMANDNSVKSLVIPLLLLNNQVFYNTLGSSKPILDGALIFPIDLTTPNVYSYRPGGSVNGESDAVMAKYLNATRVLNVRTDNPAGLAAAQAENALINAKGIKTVDVPVPEPGTAPQYTAAIRAADPQPGDAILLSLTSIGAVTTYDALQSLGLSNIPVLASEAQALPPMPGHLKDLGLSDTAFPDGWYMSDGGYTAFMPTDNSNGENVFVSMMHEYSPQTALYGYASYAFEETMDTAKFLIEAGGTSATSAKLGTLMKSYKGPAITTAGPLRCGAEPKLPNLCEFDAGWEQRKDGKWVSILDGLNGKPVDTLTQ